MRHFSDEDWLDYVREVMPPSRRSALEQHLQSECQECSQARKFWASVCSVAQREASNEVPPSAARAGETLFADWRLRFVLPVRARRARAIFDSLLEPLPAGVRAEAQAARRIAHRWGTWTVEVRIEWEPSDRVSVTGQVLRLGLQPAESSKIDLLLVSGHTPVAQTDTNRFGEFQFMFHRAPDLLIYVAVPGQEVIAVPLPEPGQPLPLKKKTSGEGGI